MKEMTSSEDMAAARENDGVNYVCPSCGYDGGSYKDGKDGWVDSTDEDIGAMCASCCSPAEDKFQCEKCHRHLSGEYHSLENCNETGVGVCLCGDCSRVIGEKK